jgi:hypothetical protein
MPTKTNYKSPVTFDLSTATTSGSGGGYINPMQQSMVTTGGKFAKGATAGLGAFGGAAGDIVGSFRGDDPTKGGYAANTAASQALKYAGMGAALGPVGAIAGGVIGGTLGLISAKKDKEEFEEQQEEMIRGEGMSTAQQQFMKNQAMYGAVDTPIAMLGKQLKSIPYTEPKNMSALQYKSGLKMKEISGVNTLPS